MRINNVLMPNNNPNFESLVKGVNQTDYYTGKHRHSIEHIDKVMLFAEKLAKGEKLSNTDRKILLAAAAFHDSSRQNDTEDSEHGTDSAKEARKYFESNPNNLYGIGESEIPIVQVVIDYHSRRDSVRGKADKETIKMLAQTYGVSEQDIERTAKLAEILKDADALDRFRFGKRGQLDPSRLRTTTAKSDKMIKFAKAVNEEYARKMAEKNYGITAIQEEQSWVSVLREKRVERKERGERITETTLSVEEMLELFEQVEMLDKKDYEQPNMMLIGAYQETGIETSDISDAKNIIAGDDRKDITRKNDENKEL